MDTQEPKLTYKQKKFVNAYLKNGGNGAKAAIEAGYSEDSAKEIASENLTKPNVLSYLKKREDELADAEDITPEKLIQQYAKLAFFDIREIFDENGGLKNIHDIEEAHAAAINAVETFEVKDGEGYVIGYTRKIKTSDRRAALDSIARMLGYNAAEKVDLTSQGEKIRQPVAKLPDGTILDL